MRNYQAQNYFDEKWDDLVDWYRDHRLLANLGLTVAAGLSIFTLIAGSLNTSRTVARNHQPELATATALLNQGKIEDAYSVARRALYSMAQKRNDAEFAPDANYQKTADSLTAITNTCQARAKQRGVTLTFKVN